MQVFLSSKREQNSLFTLLSALEDLGPLLLGTPLLLKLEPP
jgi:hypothetical protein